MFSFGQRTVKPRRTDFQRIAVFYRIRLVQRRRNSAADLGSVIYRQIFIMVFMFNHNLQCLIGFTHCQNPDRFKPFPVNNRFYYICQIMLLHYILLVRSNKKAGLSTPLSSFYERLCQLYNIKNFKIKLFLSIFIFFCTNT